MGEAFWWNWWVQLAVAVGTVGAALVALFGAAWRAQFFPPVLRLQLLNPVGEYCPMELTWVDDTMQTRSRKGGSRFYHLRVTNERRWSPARQVQVVLTLIESPGADGQMRTEFAAGAVPMRWRHQSVYPLARTIGPEADCDLLTVVEDKWLELTALIAPYNLEAKRLGACHLVLTLEARSIEATSPPLRVEVHWDGKWERGDTEMGRHLVVTETRPTA